MKKQSPKSTLKTKYPVTLNLDRAVSKVLAQPLQAAFEEEVIKKLTARIRQLAKSTPLSVLVPDFDKQVQTQMSKACNDLVTGGNGLQLVFDIHPDIVRKRR